MRLPIPDDWEGEYCRYAVCWPNSPKWKAVLRGLITQAARGWSWDERTGNIKATQAIIVETLDMNLHLPEVIMACNDDNLRLIALAINNLAKAQCCDGVPQGGGVQGQVPDGEGGFIPIYGSSPGIELPPGEAPPDYDGTYEDYLTDKCNGAHSIVDGLIATLHLWANINFTQQAGLTVLLLAALAGIIIIQPYLIVVLIGYLLLSTGINAGLVSLADEIEVRRQEIVCAMVEHDTVSGIIAAVNVIISAAIAAIPATGALAFALRGVAAILLNTDTLDQLFNATIPGVPGRDCSECFPCDAENDLRYEFESGIDGFSINSNFGSDEPLYDGLVGTWDISQQPTERLRVNNTQSIVNTKVFVQKTISHTIRNGDHLLSNATANQTVTLHIKLFTASKSQIAGFAVGSFNNGPIDVDLSAYAGADVAYIGIWVAKQSAAVYYCEFLFVAIECQ